MKVFASIVLLFFVLFLAGPTIVACLEKDKDATSLCEDCNTPSSSIEEIKHDIKYYTFNPFLEMSFFDSEKSSGLIIFENLSKHDLICASIFIPPPNKV
ncbi:MAG TPA: hypothetical protein VFS71_11775 [Flavobacterium sp.]|uniref:hypothetical protein n=1 Tax=Flavobacterium sp. TaxID=239 RepID=UPI002DBE8772|nr:hypothetical protein [Flavobacterium sp.]HEU4790357.1 hypothetical protein [Flavobacterium sp.]